MFALILYCGLISSVVSAHFNNDTSHDGDELDINTTLSTLASTTIPVSKDCVLEMKENEISRIVELFNSNLVNVVVIYISFSNGSHEGQLFSDFNVSLSNPIGREVLYALEREEFRYFPWTLKAGIRNFKLNVKGSQNDCTKTGINASDFVLESTQHIVDSLNLATNYQVCSSFKETSSGKINQTCCQMTKPNLATKFNYKCPTRSSFVFGSDLPLNVIYCVMILLAFFYFMWLTSVFLSRSEFDLKYPEYYKLEESNMSPSSILLKVIWDENGRVVSLMRRLVLVCILSYLFYLLVWRKEDIIFSIICLFLFVFCGLPFLVCSLFRSRVANLSAILNRVKLGRRPFSGVFQFFYYKSGTSWEEGKKGKFENVVKIMMLPVNLNAWRNTINILYNECTPFASCVTGRIRNRILKKLALCAYSVYAVLKCFVHVCILLCFRIVNATICPICFLGLFVALSGSLEYPNSRCHALFLVPVVVFYICLLGYIPIIITTIILPSIVSFLLGFFLNLIYFIPYFAFFSVLTFYCCTYWKTMEEQYFVLKQLIYEACRETQNINNGCIPNRHPEPNENLLPVVSKKLYDKVREELLPYDTNLFYFGLKMFWSIAFSLGIFALINMLNQFNVTGLVQVVTTASLGVMPHIFNIVGLKTSEEGKKAWNEKFKFNVKNLVEELICEDPALARTMLIIEQDNVVIPMQNDRASEETIKGSERVKVRLGSNLPSQDGELSVLAQGKNETTSDENIQSSRHAPGRSDFSSRADCV